MPHVLEEAALEAPRVAALVAAPVQAAVPGAEPAPIPAMPAGNNRRKPKRKNRPYKERYAVL